RILLKIYLDVSDLFESIMSTHSEYKVLHGTFDTTGILKEIKSHILSLADELENIALAVKTGASSVAKPGEVAKLQETRKHFESMRLNFMTGKNVENFISLGRILQNLEELTEKINVIH